MGGASRSVESGAGVGKLVESYEKEMVATAVEMVGIRAMAPASGGTGESDRAVFLQKLLESWGFEVKRYDYADNSNATRPNLIVKYGDADRTLWIMPHMDTVAEGDASLWKSDPFKAVVEDGKIYGRGTADNGQSLVGALYALKALKESGADMKYSFGLALLADEELGSEFGMQKLIKERIFSSTDLFVVPDYSTEKGDVIEIAEKSSLRLKITVTGKQAHASMPADGVNAFIYSARFLAKIYDMLHEKYNKRSELFQPDASTFEPTKHEKNVDSTNIVPGKDVFYMDCRVLPGYDLDEIIGDIEKIAKGDEFKGVSIAMEAEREDQAPQMGDTNSEIMGMLKKGIKKEYGVDARTEGIGGGTAARFLRKEGLEAAVWSTGPEVAHQPNEYMIIRNMVKDAKVFAGLFV